LNDQERYHLFLKATGVIEENGLEGQREALKALINNLSVVRADITNKLRVVEAQKTAGDRIKPDGHHYLVHMSHCYGLVDDDYGTPEYGLHRFSCKYGEDDICPAALFEDPFAEYLRIKGVKEDDCG
jgi:hypothetical protein